MGANLRTFVVIVVTDCTAQQCDAILAVMSRVAYLISVCDENGYMEFCYGVTQINQPSITKILHQIGIVNFTILF